MSMFPPVSKIECKWELLFLGLILKINWFLFKKCFSSVALVTLSNFCELPNLLYDTGHLHEVGTHYNLYRFR